MGAVLADADPADLARCRQIAVECHGLMAAMTEPGAFAQVMRGEGRFTTIVEPP